MERRYVAQAANWDLGETESGKNEIAIVFRILTENAEATHLTWRGYFTDAAWERTIESLRHCGWTGSDLSDLSGMDANQVELVVDDENYNGKTYTKVKWVNKIGGPALKAPLTGEKRKAFAAAMRDKIKTFDATNGTKKPAAKPAPRLPPPTPLDNGAPPLGDDDIPF